MLPLEVVFLLLVIIWALIGSVRGFAREIGATVAIVLAMAVMRFFGSLLITYTNKLLGVLLGTKSLIAIGSKDVNGDLFCVSASPEQFWFYVIMFTVIVYMGYQGETFSLNTNVSRAPGALLGVLAGLLNGYLIAGNLWWMLLNCAGYSVPSLGIRGVGSPSATATAIIHVLPLNVLHEPILLMGLLFLLLVLRIAK
jgi:hypothetical protein